MIAEISWWLQKWNLSKHESWIKSLPNVLTCQVSKNIGICDKHFPPDCPRIKKPGGSLVPTVPPSIFGTTKSSLFVQTAFSPRVAVTAESRRSNEETRRLEADKIISFDKIFDYCRKPHFWLFRAHLTLFCPIWHNFEFFTKIGLRHFSRFIMP